MVVLKALESAFSGHQLLGLGSVDSLAVLLTLHHGNGHGTGVAGEESLAHISRFRTMRSLVPTVLLMQDQATSSGQTPVSRDGRQACAWWTCHWWQDPRSVCSSRTRRLLMWCDAQERRSQRTHPCPAHGGCHRAWCRSAGGWGGSPRQQGGPSCRCRCPWDGWTAAQSSTCIQAASRQLIACHAVSAEGTQAQTHAQVHLAEIGVTPESCMSCLVLLCLVHACRS